MKNVIRHNYQSALIIEYLKHLSPSGITNYATTYQHDYTGKCGESRNVMFYYRSSYSASPDFTYKPPIGMGRPLTPSCGRPSGY